MSKPKQGNIIESDTSPAAKGARTRQLRRLTGLSRRAFFNRYGVSVNSLQNWEDGKNSGLTEKGAERLINSVRRDGIVCQMEWLMLGIGPNPQRYNSVAFSQQKPLSGQENKLTIAEETTCITKELALLSEHYPNRLIHFEVVDDGMEPKYFVDDIVAGCARSGLDIENLVGQDCIVRLSDGSILLRHIKQKTKKNLYMLACINQATTCAKPILYDVEITVAAPIIWVRRKEKREI